MRLSSFSDPKANWASFKIALAVLLLGFFLLPGLAQAQQVVVLEDFENPPGTQLANPIFDRFAQAFPTGSTPVSNFKGSVGLIERRHRYPLLSPTPVDGTNYVFMHSASLIHVPKVAPEAIKIELNFNGNDREFKKDNTYSLQFLAAWADMSRERPTFGWDHEGHIRIYARRKGTTGKLDFSNPPSSFGPASSPDFVLLAQTDTFTDKGGPFETYTFSFQAIDDYDELIIFPVSDDYTAPGRGFTVYFDKLSVSTVDNRLGLIKTSDVSELSDPPQVGDKINFKYDVENLGDVTLSNVAVTEPNNSTNAFTGTGDVPMPTRSSGSATLAPGGKAVFEASYEITQADIDAGKIENSALASGTYDHLGGTALVTDSSDPSSTDPGEDDITVTQITQNPDIALVLRGKFEDDGNNDKIGDVGETITYTFVIVNRGNTTLNNIEVTDPLLGTGVIGTIPSLAPGKRTRFTREYKLTQADIVAKLVENTATAKGTSPTGEEVEDISGTGINNDLPRITSIGFGANVALVVKEAVFKDDLNGDGFAQVGEKIEYTYEVYNTGDARIENIKVTDLAIDPSNAPIGEIDELATGEVSSFVVEYAITQADIDAGKVTVSSDVTADDTQSSGTVSDISGSTILDDDPTETPLTRQSSIALVVSGEFEDKNDNGLAEADETIKYTFEITNTGLTTIKNIDVTDTKLKSDGSAVGSINMLAPGETKSFMYSYPMTQEDVDAGKVTVSSLAMGDSPDGTDDVEDTSGTSTTNDDQTVTTLDVTSKIALVVTGTFEDDKVENGYVDVGETITYKFDITNTSSTTVSNIDVTDPVLKPDGTPVGTIATLAPGETKSFTFDYPITESDIEDGKVTISSKAVGDSPSGTNDVSDTSGTSNDNDTPTVVTLPREVDIDAIEEVLSDDLLAITRVHSANASSILLDATQRLVSEAEACGRAINRFLKKNPVRFANDSDVIEASYAPQLDEIARLLEECPEAHFTIAGHTDSNASDAYNIVLSKKRVASVRSALISREIARGRLKGVGYGEAFPIATNETEEGRALNRRVEFVPEGSSAKTQAKAPCGPEQKASGSIFGEISQNASNMFGSFDKVHENCVGSSYAASWGKITMSDDEDRGTIGVLNIGTQRDTQSDGVLSGLFIEGYLSRSKVETSDVTGTINGVGLHSGLYGALSTTPGLIFGYYGSLSLGRHSFDLTAGGDADGDYTYAGALAGVSLGGEAQVQNVTLHPRVGVDLAYANEIGSSISVPDVELEIEPAKYARGFVEFGLFNTSEQGDITVTPRLFCEMNSGSTSDNCGYGINAAFKKLDEGSSEKAWNIELDLEEVGTRKTGGLKVSRSRSILGKLGIAKTELGIRENGDYEASQNIEINW